MERKEVTEQKEITAESDNRANKRPKRDISQLSTSLSGRPVKKRNADDINLNFPPRKIVEIIQEISKAVGIEVKTYSSDWIVELTWKKQTHHIFGYNFGLNPSTAYLLCNDKQASYSLLDNKNIPAIEHFLVMSPKLIYCSKDGAYGHLRQIASEHNWNVVLKPKDGTGGTSVFHTKNARELEDASLRLFTTSHDLCICPYYDIKHEYRAIILNGKVELMYRKDRPHLTGDGTTTLFQLLHNFLKTLPTHEGQKLLNSIDNTAFFSVDRTDRQGFAYVPPVGEIFSLNWKHNLGSGSNSAIDFDPKKKKEIEVIALKTVKALDVVFASVDVVESKLPNESEYKLRIMEVNSGIMMESFVKHHPHLTNHCRNIYAKAVLQMFGEKFEDHKEKLGSI